MRRIALALACLFVLTLAASAQTSETRANLQSQNMSTFPPNTIGAITPQSVESLVGNMIASTGTLLDHNTFMSPQAVAGDLWASTNGAIPSTLFSTCGAPGNCNGVYLSSAQDLQAYSNIFDAAVIYSTTSRAGTIGENGLWINFNNNAGYLAPPFTNGLDKAGLQVSSFCNSGGGQCWGEAISATFASGWAGASGNFGVGLEVDSSNNATANTNPLVGGFNTTLIGLWLAGPIGAYPITDYIQISPVSNNGSVYAADFGMFVTGAHTIQDYTIWDNADATLASYFDNGTHAYGISLAGSYTTAAINIAPGGGSSGIGVAIQPGTTICFNANTGCMSYAFGDIDIQATALAQSVIASGGSASAIDYYSVLPTNVSALSGQGSLFETCPLIQNCPGGIGGANPIVTANYFKSTSLLGASSPEYGTIFDTSVNTGAAPQWNTSTVYAAGACVDTTISRTSQAGNIYCTTAGGTSASTGTGPSGTGSSITDGTVTWAYSTADYNNAKLGVFVSEVVGPNAPSRVWGVAYDTIFSSGWTGVFGANVELDATNNAVVSGSGGYNVYNEYLSGLIGTHPLGCDLCIFHPANSTNFADINAISITGSFISSNADFITLTTASGIGFECSGTKTAECYSDNSTSPAGASYGGTYSVAAIYIPSSSATAINVSTGAVSLGGALNLTGLGTGTAAKFLCLTSGNNVISQVAAC